MARSSAKPSWASTPAPRSLRNASTFSRDTSRTASHTRLLLSMRTDTAGPCREQCRFRARAHLPKRTPAPEQLAGTDRLAAVQPCVLRDTRRTVSQNNAEIQLKALDAINRRDRAAWMALQDPGLEFCADPEWPESEPVIGPEAVW